MEDAIVKFIRYYHKTKKSSDNTELSYRRDLEKLKTYLTDELSVSSWAEVTETNLNSYMLFLERSQYAPSSILRSVASIRSFYRYLMKKGLAESNPAEDLKLPKVEKKAPEILTVEEVERLLKQPDTTTFKGIRDSAMLELLYATGMRVSELIGLNVEDVNLPLSYLVCSDRKKERIIPFGNTAKKALNRYLKEARPSFVKDESTAILFTNFAGAPMSRQGFWKILKGYVKEAGIETDVTPHTLRHSFATHMIQNGANLKTMQEMLGHSDISTTQVYLNLSINRLRDAYMSAHPRK